MPVVKDIEKVKRVKVLYVVPNEVPKEVVIPTISRTIKDLIHGPIKTTYLENTTKSKVCVLSNANGSVANRIVNDNIIYGNFIIVGTTKEDNYKSLTKNQIDTYTNQFNETSIKELNAKIRVRVLARSILRR